MNLLSLAIHSKTEIFKYENIKSAKNHQTEY